MKNSRNATAFRNFGIVSLGFLLSAVSVWAQPSQLLVINANQFYPADGYPGAIGNQNLPPGYQRFIFRADSGQPISGKLTIRCRGGREYRNVSIYGSGYSGAVLQNPCAAQNVFNFDLYLASPDTSGGRYDRIRVYGDGRYSGGGGGGGASDLITYVDYNRFFPASGYLAVNLDLPSGYNSFVFRSNDRYSQVSGKLTIRCRGDRREYRDVVLSPTGGAGAGMVRNPCSRSSNLNVDVYLATPSVGSGTYGRIEVIGRR